MQLNLTLNVDKLYSVRRTSVRSIEFATQVVTNTSEDECALE